jgi:hypothetical protein
LVVVFLLEVSLSLGVSGRHASRHTIVNFMGRSNNYCSYCLRGPCHYCSCSIQLRVSAGGHIPPSLTDNDCGTSGVVQFGQTTCHSHVTSLFPWWQQLLLGSRTSR